MSDQHFLTLNDLPPADVRGLVKRAAELKQMQHRGELFEPLKNKTLAMIFSKSSTRTRVSFEAGMAQLGGAAIFLSPEDTQLGRGESIEDSARVISSMVDGVMIRTDEHQKLVTFAAHSSVPVINGLTDDFHPCQLLADIQAYVELRGDIAGRTVAWVGDGNNVCHSWINAAAIFGFELKIATPSGYQPDQSICQPGDTVSMLGSPSEAVANADLVVTDTWASMGQESEKIAREQAFADYCVDARLMRQAKADALFMHCLPAYRGSEVSAEVIDGPQSAVWCEAENRLHAQKALLEYLLG